MRKSIDKKKFGWWILAAAAVLILVLALCIPGAEAPADQTVESAPEAELPVNTPEETFVPIELENKLRVDKIGGYTGLFVEDGSDEAVKDNLMMIVTNISQEPIQFAQIEIPLGEDVAEFQVSALPAGESAVLIEQNRLPYDKTVDYAAAGPQCVHFADFDAPVSLQSDKLELQILNGVINVTNISGMDIDGTILICYKNMANGVFHGGIAYRVRVEGGLKADEIRQVMGSHFRQEESRILFVEIVP